MYNESDSDRWLVQWELWQSVVVQGTIAVDDNFPMYTHLLTTYDNIKYWILFDREESDELYDDIAVTISWSITFFLKSLPIIKVWAVNLWADRWLWLSGNNLWSAIIMPEQIKPLPKESIRNSPAIRPLPDEYLEFSSFEWYTLFFPNTKVFYQTFIIEEDLGVEWLLCENVVHVVSNTFKQQIQKDSWFLRYNPQIKLYVCSYEGDDLIDFWSINSMMYATNQAATWHVFIELYDEDRESFARGLSVW